MKQDSGENTTKVKMTAHGLNYRERKTITGGIYQGRAKNRTQVRKRKVISTRRRRQMVEHPSQRDTWGEMIRQNKPGKDP